MTDYGRSPGSQPWHPEDPLYGDREWGSRQDGGAHHQQYGDASQDPYGQGHDDRRYDAGGQGYDSGISGQGHGAAPGPGHDGGWDPGTGQHTAPPYGTPQPADPYGTPQSADPYGTGQGAGPYDTSGAYPQPEPPDRRHPDAHGGAPHPGHDRGGHGGHGGHGQGGQWPTGAPGGGPHPSFPGDRYPEDRGRPADDRGWDGHAAGGGSRRRGDDGHDGHGDEAYGGAPHGDDPHGDEAYGDEPAGSRHEAGSRRGRTKKRKSRNGVACLFVALVLAGGLGGAGYFGYQFWQDRFGPAPDFSGSGTGETVTVEVPKGAVGAEIGGVLVKQGVVKSVDAFVAAQGENPKGLSIQPGFYTLRKGMSAAAAVDAMLDPKSRNVLIIPEGKRNAWVYQQVDKRLELAPGTTEKVARNEAGNLGLPEWATGHPDVKDPLEGFLFPADYPVAKGNKPEDVLRKMVARANSEYGRLDLEAKAGALGLEGPWELVTVASLVQAEGKTEDDFRKMSEVVYNRLKPTNTETNQLLQFDSAFNYLKGQSEIEISESEINSNRDPYNTYTRKGLTPGPIGNPGKEALAAALTPTAEGWMYFVATDGMNKTEFARTHDEFLKLKDKFNDNKGG
ncbi:MULTISPECIES: endolytic transglycosylase MltG [Streptomyces]|uniref:Endolytic murein transglycosylase n=1 Tax=Streptomyces sudanensis TaxID=436397 RepID=A0ABY4TGI3_9ACTN|nr:MULTISPECIES: endolytic transglycosylase MltG [Streptomyces]URN18027.1 endolytic transglycosylase MltG [Streptomyces sudanensis]